MGKRDEYGLLSLEGTFSALAHARFGIAAARFNESIVGRLIEGAKDGFIRHGIDEEQLTLCRVPGSFELPWACQQLASSGEYAAVIAIGVLIRGETSHYEYIASAAASGCSQVALSTGVPVIFGILTCLTLEQAMDRAGSKAGNKGYDAALAALELASLRSQFGGD